MRGSPRVTALRATGEVVRDALGKEGGHGHRPCEETRAPCSAPVRRKQLQKSAGSILASNKLVRSAPKRVAVRVNGGLGGAASGTKVSESASIETVAGVSVCALVQRRMVGLDPERRQNVVQRSSHSPKAVWRSWDRGCKGHRILRRVLVGGRHLRTSRAIGFHESVVKATLAASSRGKRRR
jgi:hypothetical protein